MAEHTLPTGNGPRIWQCIEQKLLQIDPGHGGTHSVDRKSTLDVATKVSQGSVVLTVL